MYKHKIFLYGGKGLQKRGRTLYNRKSGSKASSQMKGLDNYLLSMIKGVSLHSGKKKYGGSAQHKSGGGLKFVR